jgi:hypothetical protein
MNPRQLADRNVCPTLFLRSLFIRAHLRKRSEFAHIRVKILTTRVLNVAQTFLSARMQAG